MATKESYDRKLEELYQEVLRMGVLVEENLKFCGDLLKDKSEEIYKRIRLREEEINGLEIEIEDKFITLIAIEHPVAGDLRKIVASLKILAHLERMGDYAVHVAKALRSLGGKALAPFTVHVTAMLKCSEEMLDQTLTAFMRSDTAGSRAAAARDDEIDAEHDLLIGKLYSEEHVTRTAKEFARILFLGRNLERIGDHITNICEWIVYSGECRHIELNE